MHSSYLGISGGGGRSAECGGAVEDMLDDARMDGLGIYRSDKQARVQQETTAMYREDGRGERRRLQGRLEVNCAASSSSLDRLDGWCGLPAPSLLVDLGRRLAPHARRVPADN